MSRVRADGTLETVLEDLRSPEGICFDPQGNLYVTEDVASGRILRLTPGGDTTTVARADAPEGVAWSGAGFPVFSWSTLQVSPDPLSLRTGVAVAAGPTPDTLLVLSHIYSFSDLAVDAGGRIYAANELAVPGTGAGVVVLDPSTGDISFTGAGTGTCEGLSFHPGGEFPLLIAEENPDGSGGRLSAVSGSGESSVLAGGFGSLEDVAVGPDGRIYLTDDASGSIVVLETRVQADQVGIR